LRCQSGGDPPLVIVGIEADQIGIMEAGIDWSDVTRPMTKGKPFAKVPLRTPAVRVAELISMAHGKRLSRFRWCPMCRETMEPEHMHGRVCQGCASKHFGIVY
jgi:hypothetical protein